MVASPNDKRGPSPLASALPEAVACPFCGSRDSEPLAAYGSLLMTSQYYCNGCRTTFEWMRRESERG